MFGGASHEHGRWKQRLRKVFGRTPSDHPTSFDSSSARSTPRVDENGNAIVEGGALDHSHIRTARELAMVGGAAEASLLARLGVDPITGQPSNTMVYKTMVEPDRGNRVPSKQKVKNWLQNVPDEFEAGPLDKDPEEWSR